MSDRPSLLRRIDQTHVPMLLARVVVGGMFVYLAIRKLEDPILFLKNVREYHLLPESPPLFINLTAISLPWIEILCGLLLLAGVWMRGAAATVLVMLLCFTPALLIRSLGIYQSEGVPFCSIEFDCGCGTGPIVICRKLVENGGLIVLSVVALLSRSRFLALQRMLTVEASAA